MTRSVSVMLLAVASGLGGCMQNTSTTTVERGRPISQAAVEQIVIGKTTRAEVFKLLGTPHSIFQGQVEFAEFGAVGFYVHGENRYLSSFDDRHVAMLYRAGSVASKGTQSLVLFVDHRDNKTKIRTDELLLLIDKETGIVDAVAYQKDSD